MSVNAPEAFHLQLTSFEGPLDLLLHLIDKQERSIYDIPIAVVTDQYLALLRDSLALQMEVASEFIVMAATLIALKARSLLPRPEPTELQLQCDLDAEFVDPEWELTQRLLDYRV
ncbi:MAG: segregation/condensation protein A, partial [Firmicutes bacterium]|nr:segregation/condensation protein A [Bacillota bacterium]